MRVAVPQLGSRVSPRCLIADELVLATVNGGVVESRATEPVDFATEEGLVERLLELGVEVLVCGGIRRDVEGELREQGVRVLGNVAGEIGEILDAVCEGSLSPGRVFPPAGTSPRAPRETFPVVDCHACEDRPCERGLECPVELGANAPAWFRGGERRIFETGRDVSAETDPKLCRIAELVHFCLGTGYRRLGLAYCWELAREVDVLVPVLRRFFHVVPVCCRLGSRRDGEDGRVPCNPAALARTLTGAETDLNVAAGLCIGCDILFQRLSHAPVTTLFVKDRALAHNPVGAIYTRYHLMDLESAPARAAVRSGRR